MRLIGQARRTAQVRTVLSIMRRRAVGVPTDDPAVDAIFLVLRRIRAPMILLIVVFTVSIIGLVVIPGQDAEGNRVHLSIFDAFYFMTYTATTIGFGEIPYSMTVPQRMWVSAMIFASVIAWAYAFGSLFTLLQERAFTDAIARQSFARKVRALREPFLVVVGYGQMGRSVVETLDRLGRRCVVVDSDGPSVEQLRAAQLAADVPGLVGDARNPGTLGLAGLGSRYCEGVLALTDDESTNLAIVMAVTLLRAEVPVIARSNDRTIAKAMWQFGAHAVVNPFDRYGGYLLMALQRPVTFRLVSWLIASPGEELPEETERQPWRARDGLWVVVADGAFGREIAADLEEAGLDVTVVDPSDGPPDIADAVGFIAGTRDDAINLALAGHARRLNPRIFVSVRQQSRRNEPLLKAFEPDSVFIPSVLTTQEALARVITPDFWAFVDHAADEDEEWSAALLERLVAVCGTGSPDSDRFLIDRAHAPALARWLRTRPFTLGDMMRHPEDRDRPLAAVPVMLIRDGQTTFLPPDDTELRLGDVVVAVGRDAGLDLVGDSLFHDHTVEYLATGRQVPATWLFRALQGSPREGAGS